MNQILKRPANLDEYREAAKKMITEEAFNLGLAFQPRATDVFIATFAKAGTTWMQQIVHGLRTRGSMDFGEITEVVPWIEVAHDLDINPNNEQTAYPRAFKTHLNWENVPKGGRYIAIYRDPKAVAVSYFRFLRGWFFESGSISMETFIREIFLNCDDSDNYWDNIRSWWQVSDSENVMSLVYEDMDADLPGIVARVAKFIDLQPDDETLSIAIQQARFNFMKINSGHFDDHLLRNKRDAAAGLPPGGESNKVSSADSAREVLNQEIVELLDDTWNEKITKVTGLKNYTEFCQSIHERNQN